MLEQFEKGLKENLGNPEITTLDLKKISLLPCLGCEECTSNGGLCVQKDETNDVIKYVIEADALILGSPIYWWGMTAQMKTFIDKWYCLGGHKKDIKPKKVGHFSVGGASVGAIQYSLISSQYDSIFDYLGWNIVFGKTASAMNVGEVFRNETLMAECYDLWKLLVG